MVQAAAWNVDAESYRRVPAVAARSAAVAFPDMAKVANRTTGVPKGEEGQEVVWKGNELLRPFLVPIRNLREDDRNANMHPDRSIEAIAASYLRFGQAKPLVTAADGTVKDGNGQLVAAAGLGWTHVAVIPSDLDGQELAAYALAVNRIPELAEWDFDRLARQLKDLEADGADVADLGWEPDELRNLLTAPELDEQPDSEPGHDSTHTVVFEAADGKPMAASEGRFEVVVSCRDESDQKSVYDRLRLEGYACRVVPAEPTARPGSRL